MWVALIPMMISVAASIASSISSALAGPTEQQKMIRDAARTQTLAQQSLVNPNHPFGKALRDQYKSQLDQNSANAVMSEMLARRRSIAAGNIPQGVDTSRRDEARSGAINKAFQDNYVRATQLADQQLRSAAGGGALAGYVTEADATDATRQQNTNNLLTNGPLALGNLASMFSSLYSGMGSGDSTGTYGSGAANSGQAPNGAWLQDAYTGTLGGGV